MLNYESFLLIVLTGCFESIFHFANHDHPLPGVDIVLLFDFKYFFLYFVAYGFNDFAELFKFGNSHITTGNLFLTCLLKLFDKILYRVEILLCARSHLRECL